MTDNPVLTGFFSAMRQARQVALLLDYDGTLAPFQVDRSRAVPFAGVCTVLDKIHSMTATRIVIISGRALADLLPLLRLDFVPELWGSHGWERLDSVGRRTDFPLAREQAVTLAEAWDLVARRGVETFCERKPASIALHWRGLPQADALKLKQEIGEAWQAVAKGHPMEVHPFDGGLELRACGRTKATAVEELLAEMADGQPVAFLGDDLTDEDGFRAIQGRGLGILVREAFRPTAASVHLRPPQQLIDFFHEWLRHAPRRPPQPVVEVP